MGPAFSAACHVCLFSLRGHDDGGAVHLSALLPVSESVRQKNEPLHELLRSVYVESTDPAATAEVRASGSVGSERFRMV